MNALHRRHALLAIPAVGLGTLGLLGAGPVVRAAWTGFPKQDPLLVADIVGAAHSDEARVRALLDAHPALVHACWDWGFGDWETALGAASHTGQRAIAELLIARGARVDIFAASMLGMLDVVKSFVGASAGVQRALGPHCITLLAHSRAGGDLAVGVVEYLKTLGDADAGPQIVPLSDDQRSTLTGAYACDDGTTFSIRAQKTSLEFVSGSLAARRLHHIGEMCFFPAGVPAVKFVFRENAVTILDHDLRVEASRA